MRHRSPMITYYLMGQVGDGWVTVTKCYSRYLACLWKPRYQRAVMKVDNNFPGVDGVSWKYSVRGKWTKFKKA